MVLFGNMTNIQISDLTHFPICEYAVDNLPETGLPQKVPSWHSIGTFAKEKKSKKAKGTAGMLTVDMV